MFLVTIGTLTCITNANAALKGIIFEGKADIWLEDNGKTLVVDCYGVGLCASITKDGDGCIHFKVPSKNIDIILNDSSTVNDQPVGDIPPDEQFPNGTYTVKTNP